MTWAVDVAADGQHIHVTTPDDELIPLRGTVTFEPGEALGSWCCQPVAANQLGVQGADIVSRLRGRLSDPKIAIRAGGFDVHLDKPEEANIALGIVSYLERAHSRSPHLEAVAS